MTRVGTYTWMTVALSAFVCGTMTAAGVLSCARAPVQPNPPKVDAPAARDASTTLQCGTLPGTPFLDARSIVATWISERRSVDILLPAAVVTPEQPAEHRRSWSPERQRFAVGNPGRLVDAKTGQEHAKCPAGFAVDDKSLWNQDGTGISLSNEHGDTCVLSVRAASGLAAYACGSLGECAALASSGSRLAIRKGEVTELWEAAGTWGRTSEIPRAEAVKWVSESDAVVAIRSPKPDRDNSPHWAQGTEVALYSASGRAVWRRQNTALLSIDPSGATVLCAEQRRTGAKWLAVETRTGRVKGAIDGPQDASDKIAWGNGGVVAYFGPGGLNVWDLVGSAPQVVSKADGSGSPVFSHNGATLFAGGILLSWPALAIVGVVTKDDVHGLYGYWSPTDKYIAFSNNEGANSDIGIRVWSRDQGKMVWDTGRLENVGFGDGRPGAWTSEDTIIYAREHALCEADLAARVEQCLVLRDCAVGWSAVWLSSEGGVMGDVSLEEARSVFHRSGLAGLPGWRSPSWTCSGRHNAVPRAENPDSKRLCARRAAWSQR